MDTVGTFEGAEVLAKRKCITAIHKHYTVDEWTAWAAGRGREFLPYVAVSTGILGKDMDKLDEVLRAVPELKFICIDVANGYAEAFVQCIRGVHARWPEKTIMAGNVVTKEMTEELIFSGADITGGDHHGRQRRDQGDDGGAHFQRRGHHQGGHRPRQCLHYSQADRRWLPPALCRPRVLRRGARPARARRLGRRVHLPGRRLQGLRR